LGDDCPGGSTVESQDGWYVFQEELDRDTLRIDSETSAIQFIRVYHCPLEVCDTNNTCKVCFHTFFCIVCDTMPFMIMQLLRCIQHISAHTKQRQLVAKVDMYTTELCSLVCACVTEVIRKIVQLKYFELQGGKEKKKKKKQEKKNAAQKKCGTKNCGKRQKEKKNAAPFFDLCNIQCQNVQL